MPASRLAAVQVGPAACLADSASLRVDHVVVVVSDLDRASATFRSLGFTLKEGRLHANGLRNRHVKLRAGNALELMALTRAPGDAVARRYANLLAESEGGAYLALAGDVQAAIESGRRLGLDPVVEEAGGLRYVTFPGAGLRGVFALEPLPVSDPDSLLTHRNGAQGITEVWLEGGDELSALLRALGARDCGGARLPGGREGVALRLERVRLVIVPPPPDRAPRVLGVVLETTSWIHRGVRVPPSAARGMWLAFAPIELQE